jgi:hypothetical protein
MPGRAAFRAYAVIYIQIVLMASTYICSLQLQSSRQFMPLSYAAIAKQPPNTFM